MAWRLLDLYCGEGGAAAGYALAGAEVIGVDFRSQPRYPFAFIRANVVEDLSLRFLQSFDAIHASPPCQFGTELNSDRARHLNLIQPTRRLLLASGLPYVIENVRAVRPYLVNPVSLFGTMFDLHLVTSTGQRFDLSRERCFETNWPLVKPWNPGTQHPVANIFGGHLRARSGPYRTGNGTGRTRDFIGEDKPGLARQMMEMPWATMNGMSEAVPPAYCEAIGAQLLAHLTAERRAA